ncbi:oxidoreductase, NAD-binding domain protein [Streptomyces ipomoeae 91-03]|uniref:Oxidoreductase, NAD-binding domain protein n=2 Tax=Streptomyces ipomoeae TaxID=103232 RepID=L1KUS7_9ACTN|nr:oxidoreductase, NAD-binding domain protein [Streptomyces ipomoeae 91-03]
MTGDPPASSAGPVHTLPHAVTSGATIMRHPRPLRLGVLGCADIARRHMLPALVADGDIALVAVASRSAAKAASFAERFGCAPVRGYERLLARSDIDAVYIPLPAMLHAEWVDRALASGHHVLVEKPLTASHAQTAALVARARAQRLVLFENFMFTHHSQHARVRALLDGGEIGELRAFSATFTIPPRPADDIRYDPATGGGALLDVGVHPVRAALSFLGPDLEVAGAVLRRDARGGAVLSGNALLHTPEGVVGRIAFGMEHAYACAYELHGATGRLILDRAFTPPADHRPVVRIEGPDGSRELPLEPDHQFANVVRAFTAAVRHGTGRDTYADLSLRQAGLVDAIAARATTVTVRT